MAVYKIFPTKDATLYSEFPNMNTGLDEIIEASTYVKEDAGQVSRYLIQFSTSEMNNIINTKTSNGEWTAYLRNFNAVVTGLNLDTKLLFYPVAGNWGMGTGKFGDDQKVGNGVSWNWVDYSGSQLWPLSSYPTYVTASWSGSLTGGGNWYTGSNLGLDVTQEQTFNYSDTKDINVEVKSTVETWFSYSLNPSDGFRNDGFLIKQTDSNEFVDNINNQKTFRYFSIDTHTIYPPQLEFRWNDFVFDTGSSTNVELPAAESFISIYNNAGVYYSQSIPRLRFAAMPKYPDVVFQTASLYTKNYYLPQSQSFYAVKDTETNEFVIDFDDDYTRISADTTSSYFDLYCSGLEPERYYTVLVKTIIGGTTKVFDENIMFKIAKG